MQISQWEKAEIETKARYELARSELIQVLQELSAARQELSSTRKTKGDIGKLENQSKDEYGKITHAITGATIDYKSHTDMVLRLKAQNFAIEQKIGVLSASIESKNKTIENFQNDINKSELLANSLHSENSKLRIENQEQIRDMQERTEKLEKLEKQFEKREENIKEKIAYIHQRQIEQDERQYRLNILEKRLNKFQKELRLNQK